MELLGQDSMINSLFTKSKVYHLQMLGNCKSIKQEYIYSGKTQQISPYPIARYIITNIETYTSPATC